MKLRELFNIQQKPDLYPIFDAEISSMPRISLRGQSMPSSPIRKLVPFSDAAKERGIDVIHLNIGQPDIETPIEMLTAIRNYAEPVIAYTQSGGVPSYRHKLVDYYAKHDIHVEKDDILVTTGGSEALLFAIFSILDDGDEIIIPEPFYANYNGFSQAGNITVQPITSSISDGFALPEISAFKEKINKKTKAILICNPNNPTGYLYTKQELEQLREIVLEHDLFLIVDEVYREFVYDGKNHTSVLSLDGLDEHAIVVDSVSKRYSACGARVGAVVSRNLTFMQTVMKFAQARLSPPAIAQAAAEAAVDVPNQYFEEVRTEYVSRRDFVVQELNKIPGVVCPNPGGAFYCMLQLPVDDTEAFCKWLLTDFSFDGSTIMLAPAAGFYSSKGLGSNQARLAYVLEKNKLAKALECLRLALQEYDK